jgi:cation diffusion facilitator family transporter
MSGSSSRVQRLALTGLLTNLGLAGVKFSAGVLGNSYALIADAIESLADIFGSLVIWLGLRVGARPASERHPYGYGKAESLAAAVVAVVLFGAGVSIAVEAIREIRTPHHAPAWWTLLVLGGTVIIKEGLFRFVRHAAGENGSAAVETDAWHHRADAITSAAAFIGIAIALIGGPGYEAADDWAALFAAGIIFINSWKLVVTPVRELLDVTDTPTVEQATRVAAGVPGVVSVHKVFARKSGAKLWLDMHIWVDPAMPVRKAHALSHAVKDAIREKDPRVSDVLIHIEPAAEPDGSRAEVADEKV